MSQSIEQATQALIESYPKNTEYLVAFSGGLDSSVLLHGLSKLQSKYAFKIKVIHVNHQLQDVADEWVEFCQLQCNALGLTCQIETVSIDQDSGDSLEAMARHARYAVFAKHMHETACLLTAHHADDQFETFLLQLFRGAGPKGLSAMAKQKSFKSGQHARPFLSLNRAQMKDYAVKNNIQYIQDPSNDEIQFDRNFLRSEIIPQIKARYSNVQNSVSRSAEHIATEHFVLDTLLNEKLQKLLISNTLNLTEWNKFGKNIQALLLRKWVSDSQLQLPSTKILEDVLLQLKHAHGESKTNINWAGVEIRAYSQRAFLLTKIDEDVYKKPAGSLIKNSEQLQLPENYGTLSFNSGADEYLQLRLGFRSGGEKLRLPKHKHHVSLKQLCQKNRVLPWMRSRIPLLFEGDELVAIGDLWLNADWLDRRKLPNFAVNWNNKPLIFVP